eukprot:TRINITY_DN8791_c0_g1_i2.p1 TRINITY_DN8791_c0_g1~~TRINITY_DN8791_c0_g1_i2.p1  ORF type:complete len:765 (-),score=191.26 TRINITY_DN8791_c0_g1_i2:96-2075(-)
MKEQGQTLCVSAVGGAISYLKRLLLDKELVSLGNFRIFDPASPVKDDDCLLLDGSSLANLEILTNNEGTHSGSLLSFIDFTVTAFGKRLFRQWLSRPLLSVSSIQQRLDAVEDLMRHPELLSSVRAKLKQLPDLERYLARIHSLAIGRDRDAVMYGNVNEKRLKTFLSVVNGLKESMNVIRMFEGYSENFGSARLRYLVGEGYPDLTENIEFFASSFDLNEAKKSGSVVPNRGVDEELDQLDDAIQEITQALEDYLTKQKRALNEKNLKYYHRNKERYQIEVPTRYVESHQVPREFELMSQTKQVYRYWSPSIKKWVEQLDEAEEKKSDVLKDVMCRVFGKFASHYELWIQAVRVLAELDCLCSLASYSANADGVMCRPQFLDPQEHSPTLELRGCRHPAVAATARGDQFIPNDTVLGTAETPARFILVTGPNMGGKSTLLRQTCVAVILAQLGCFVPAEQCILTPVDRIFTRIGAHDRILAGQSTFYVELEETANILRHATSNSLVILDELGRGTSTFDGTAIAHAVISHLSKQLGCRCLFSTHYHMLTEDFAHDPSIAQYHMAASIDHSTNQVCFLYKFVQGTSSKSHGMNVARLAGLPDSVVDRATLMSEQFEETLRRAHNSGLHAKMMMMKRILLGLDQHSVSLVRKTIAELQQS